MEVDYYDPLVVTNASISARKSARNGPTAITMSYTVINTTKDEKVVKKVFKVDLQIWFFFVVIF